MKYLNILKSKPLLSVLAGAILTLAFSPFNLWQIAIIIPALFYALLYKESFKRSMVIGWLFGVGFFGTSVSWVYVSIVTYGPPNPYLAVLITALFIATLAIFFLLMAAALAKIFPNESLYKCCLAYPPYG